MVKMIRSFRVQMILLFAFSMILSGGITFLSYKALQLYYRNNVFEEDSLAQIRSFIRNIGDINFFLIIFIPLSILFFYFLTKPYTSYFNEISKGIHYLARGDFQHQVQIHSNDEFKTIAQDINVASKKLEEAINRGDFSESSKDQLVVNLAHDLRTPLTSVLGYLDLMRKDDQLTQEEKKHFLTIAFNKSQRLEKLIDELFEITRMNYGMLSIAKEQINISDLLIQLQEELYPIFEKNHLQVRMRISPALFIAGDGELLARVFENLLTNANRYGCDGQFIDINAYIEANDVVVQMVNYGNHIPAEAMPYLFDMFYKGDKARTQLGGSTGLGLFIAKNIVEQHDGTISAESNARHTIFEVRLPQVPM